MIKNISLRMGKNPFEPLSLRATSERGIVGTNAGNMVFSETAFKTLSAPGVHITPQRYSASANDPDLINEQFDAVVLPFANAFRIPWKENLKNYTRLVSQLKIPVIVMGVGVQTDFEYDLDKLEPIGKEVKQLVSAVLDRSATIGVRGECTKAFLNKLGFRDEYIDVIGCPSMYRYGRQFPLDVNKLEKSPEDINYSLNVSGFGGDSFKAGQERALSFVDYNVKKYSDSVVVLQNVSGALAPWCSVAQLDD